MWDDPGSVTPCWPSEWEVGGGASGGHILGVPNGPRRGVCRFVRDKPPCREETLTLIVLLPSFPQNTLPPRSSGLPRDRTQGLWETLVSVLVSPSEVLRQVPGPVPGSF